ncbi:MAG TPA: hypothetical protein VFT45_28090, partial [Longimicrobium sp.]|nr:hypothetical protein [Longimicrobium sp.]
VRTAPSARRRPRVLSVTLHIDDPRQPCNPHVCGKIDATRCSALFWSESAVEKFLLPYYASAAGPQAYEVLYALIRVWYYYDESRPVVALAFSYAPVGYVGLKSLWNTVEVIYIEDGRLRQLPLLHFMADTTTLEAPALPEPYPISNVWNVGTEQGVPTPIDRLGARDVAEYVSGLRGREVLVYEVDRGGGLEPLLSPVSSGAPPLFEAFCPYVRKDRPQVSSVTLVVEEPGCCEPRCHRLGGSGKLQPFFPDSVFWTDGSVETLLLPYYAGVEGGAAPWQLTVMLDKWSGSIPPQRTTVEQLWGDILVSAAREMSAAAGGPAVRATEESTVFAIIHLPNSDWIDWQEGTAITQNITLSNRLACVSAAGVHPLVDPRRPLVRRRV